MLTNLGDPAGDFENTRNLVFTGLYRWIRHPLYASLLLFGMGAVLKNISTASLALFIGAAVFVYATARVEENENLEKFGDEYREYSKKTKMFIPYLF